MEESLKVQIVKDIIYLIKDGQGIIYNGDKFDHVFNMIFGGFFVEICLDFNFSQLSISLFKGSSSNYIEFDATDSFTSDLITILRDKFDMNEHSYFREFSQTVKKYSRGEDISDVDLEVRLDKLISSERYEEAEELKKKIKELKKRRKNGK